jgi:hypothetical protein
MNIFFVYASGDCESGGLGGWNIQPGTVIRFTVYPKVKPKLSELGIDASKFEKRADIGDSLLYVNEEEGISMGVYHDDVQSFNYGPSKRDEYLRCPGYDGIHYDSTLPRELRPRLLQRLNEFVQCSFAGDYEKQYSLYESGFAAKWFGVKNARAFAELVRRSARAFETLIEFKPDSIREADDKTYGMAYDVSGHTKEILDGKTVEGYRQTRVLLRGGDFYFIDQFRLLPR